jgi:hypothetical protein
MRTFVEEYRTDDKSTWERGPWDDEPDKVVWVDEATGLDCMAHRNHSGNWCGYVGVPEGHRAYERGYDDVPAVVHGGLTYANFCQEGCPPEYGICHLPQEGRPDKVWWLGFDCGHWMDYLPGMAARLKEIRASHPEYREYPEERDFGEKYRTLDYVVSEVTQLAAQVAAVR